jgi:tRNA dimethylallyltransferase
LPIDKKMSAGQYARRAEEIIRELLAQGKTPIVVGGTGLYFRSLLKGIAEIPQVSKEVRQKWQERVAAEGAPALHRELAAIDGAYASKIHPNDRQRITRALEVFESTGRTFSWWHQHSPLTGSFDYLYLGIGLPLPELEPVLARRIDGMLKAGALDEARSALEKNSDPKAPGWSGIGCAELYRHLMGKLDLDDARALWRRNTRAYAKRQLTWFRAEPEIQWFSPHDYHALLELAQAALQNP